MQVYMELCIWYYLDLWWNSGQVSLGLFIHLQEYIPDEQIDKYQTVSEQKSLSRVKYTVQVAKGAHKTILLKFHKSDILIINLKMFKLIVL